MWRAWVYEGAQATGVTSHGRPHPVAAQVRARQTHQEGEYAMSDKSTSCLNSAGATSHCLRRDKAPHPAVPGSAVAPGLCQCFGSGAQPAQHLCVSWQPARQEAQELTGTQETAGFGGFGLHSR